MTEEEVLSNWQSSPIQFYKPEYKPTKREYFAAMAMANFQGNSWSAKEMAKRCVSLADALIEELDKFQSAIGESVNVTITKEDHFKNSNQ